MGVIKSWGSPTKTSRLEDAPAWLKRSESAPKRTKILAPRRVMVELGLDFNNPDERFELPTQCGMTKLRPATLPLRGRNPCCEPEPADTCCDFSD